MKNELLNECIIQSVVYGVSRSGGDTLAQECEGVSCVAELVEQVTTLYMTAANVQPPFPSTWQRFVDTLYRVLCDAIDVPRTQRARIWMAADYIRRNHCGSETEYIPAALIAHMMLIGTYSIIWPVSADEMFGFALSLSFSASNQNN